MQDSDEIDSCRSIYAGKLRRFHGKKLSWYLTQPKIIFWNLRDVFLLTVGFVEALVYLLLWRPDVVFAKGGYVSLPVGLAAAFLRIPLVIHDSDTLPGLTNRILSRYATKICVGQPLENYPNYPSDKLVYCGVPISDTFYSQLSSAASKKQLGITLDSKLIAVIGGSLGAMRINEAVLSQLDAIMQDGTVCMHWVCGAYHYDQLLHEVQHKTYKHKIKLDKFTNELPTILNAADVVISRTGATSLAELAALSKPTILVPNPLLTGGHQLSNAKVYAKSNAAVVIQELQLKEKPVVLRQAIVQILTDSSLQQNLAANISKFAVPHSADNIADVVLTVRRTQKKKKAQ